MPTTDSKLITSQLIESRVTPAANPPYRAEGRIPERGGCHFRGRYLVRSEKETFMISDETKKKIDALSMEDLLHEVMKQSSSCFQGENHDYLLARFAIVERREEDEHKKHALGLAQEANDIARVANQVAVRAERWAMYAAIAAVIALIISAIGWQK